jgi:hypothetical protein
LLIYALRNFLVDILHCPGDHYQIFIAHLSPYTLERTVNGFAFCIARVSSQAAFVENSLSLQRVIVYFVSLCAEVITQVRARRGENVTWHFCSLCVARNTYISIAAFHEMLQRLLFL